MAYNAADYSDNASLPSYHTYPQKAHTTPPPASSPADDDHFSTLEISDVEPESQQQPQSNRGLILEFFFYALIPIMYFAPFSVRVLYLNAHMDPSDFSLSSFLRNLALGAMTYGFTRMCSWLVSEKAREFGWGDWWSGLAVVILIPSCAMAGMIFVGE